MFTYNNPVLTKEEMAEKLREYKTRFLVIGRENAPTTGTEHLQGYVYWEGAKTMKQLTKKFPGVHWIVAKGSAEQNKEYCTKTDSEAVIWGEPPRQGKRKDLDVVRELVAEGRGLGEIVMECRSFQSFKLAETMMKYNEKKRDWKPKVEWYYGKTGCGKTRSALEAFEDRYWISGKNLKWWEGYDAEPCVLIDDFRKDFCTFHELLRILDRYEYRIECKGGSRQLLAKHIIITSPYHPLMVYETREDVQQLIRRSR